ncbi:MAG TPA: xanthine dehydrogenase family protein subunit M [Victivallales bacterium]|nr:xanthine dehydrogenase family protein subunit M [Victivallales bacterium]
MNVEFDYMQPNSLKDLFQLLGNESKIIAGGTDLIPFFRKTETAPKNLIDISQIKKLNYIREFDDEIELGALTTFKEIYESEIIREYAPGLADASSQIGSPMIQNRATIGGNIANASPAADSVLPLICLDAVLTVSSEEGDREVQLEDFFKSKGVTDISPNEIINKVTFFKRRNCKDFFKKVGLRKGLVIATASLAVKIVLDADNRINHVRIAAGSVAPVPLRCYKTEEYLSENIIDDQIISKAKDILINEISPISDLRSTVGYRRKTICELLSRILNDLLLEN